MPGILKDLGQSAEAKSASQIVGKGVGKAVTWVDAVIRSAGMYPVTTDTV